MKVSYQGKITKFSKFPKDMNEIRRVVQRKVSNRSLRSPDANDSRVLSDAFNNSVNSNENSQAPEFFNNQIASRDKQGSIRGTG
jgi:hypothetical protein